MNRPRTSPAHCPGPLSRRGFLEVGAASLLGLGFGGLIESRAANVARGGGTFGKAKSCVIIFLSGGPPQHETFDPKPDAPLEIRGTFRSIATKVPGIRICETLPHTARITDRLAIIRSMTTDINAHSTSGAFMLTGYVPPTKAENVPAGSQDWPSIASVVGAMKPSERSPLSSVVLPELVHNNGNITWPGQNGGFMGAAWHPMMMKCDPNQQPMHIEGMSLADGVTSARLSERFDLLTQMDAQFQSAARSGAVAELGHMRQKAFDLLHSDASRRAFEIERESAALRENYGRHKFSQSLLLSRRLVEAGVRLVQVNWPRDPGDENIGNPMWDTHQKNADRVRDSLCPKFDRPFATFIADMQSRGLLDETLVVVMSEFGRSPKINGAGGRDHWGSCFSVVLAGAGIGGQVIGESDRIGAFPQSRPVHPPDLAATIFHFLGLDPAGEFIDPLGRPRRLTDNGEPLRELIG